MSKEKQLELNKMVNKFEQQVFELEQELVDFALEHELHLSLGDYGSGRELLLKDDDDRYGSGKKRGEWLYSSETC